MLKVLVTGANGYIGQHVVNEAVRQGFDVVTVDLKNQKKTEETCHIELNILENASLPNLYEILGKPDVIIHLAWQNGFNHNADSHLISLPSHYAFLKNMIDAGCPSVSIMGSMHEIGYFEGKVTADTPCNPLSLYGISNLEEISKKIFIETTQLMDKNLKKFMDASGVKNIPEYAKTGLDMANFFGVTQNGDRIDYGQFFSTDDKVLCFDDLERANVDVIDILGYINNFVEHDHIKTIIICNEKELSTKLKNSNLEMKTFIATYLLDKENKLNIKTDKPMVERIRDTIEYVFDKANDYERIKEKLIGETFEYAPEFTYIINGLLMRYENCPDLIRFLRENTNLIISTFNKSGTRNLRILKHSLTNFKKIFDEVNKSYPNTNHRVLQTMLIFTIAISFEIKAGKITKDKFVNINDN